MKIDTEIRHVTKPGANLFMELGFGPDEAQRLGTDSRCQADDNAATVSIPGRQDIEPCPAGHDKRDRGAPRGGSKGSAMSKCALPRISASKNHVSDRPARNRAGLSLFDPTRGDFHSQAKENAPFPPVI